MREVRFALGYMPHRLWGNILQAQILNRESGKVFFSPLEYVQNDDSTRAYQSLTPMQKELVGLVDSYSDRNLHRVFSKKNTVKTFLDSVEKRTIQELIRPHIERYLYTALEIARDNRIPLFVKDKSNRNIFPEDFIRIEPEPAIPLFSFEYHTGLSYSLNLVHHDRKLILHNEALEIVSNHPLAVILGNTLYFINDIDGKKLKPFLEKEHVTIPAEMEKKYFSTFVKNSIQDFNTHVEGIPMMEIPAEKRAEILLEIGMDGSPVWILSFQYNKQTIHADSRISRFVNYTGDGKHHGFEKFDRDPAWEEGVINTLKELGLKSREDRIFYLRGDLYSAINFINENTDTIRDAGIDLRQRLGKPYYLGTIVMDLDSEEKEDWFDVRAVVRFGTYKLSFLLLKDHILKGIREFELPDGEIAILPEEWYARYRSMFEFGNLKGDRIRIHRQHFAVMDTTVRMFHPETLERLERLNKTGSIPTLEIPVGIKAEMRSYQVEGFTWLCHLQQNGFGGCLADDMGLGKTLQAIAVLMRSKELAEMKCTSLVVVPASLLHNWTNECRRFAPGLKVHAHFGVQRNHKFTNFGYYDVILSTYHTVRQDIEQLSSFRFHYVILDESQMIKNPSSKLYQAVSELQSEHKIVLTGTPVENSLIDLWSQVNFVNPGLLGSLSFFKQNFVQPIERGKDEVRENKLKELINPFILRRTKQEVARELPPILEQVRYCSMTESQRKAYEEEKSLARNSILENLEEVGLERSSMKVLRALTRLRQIANHPAMVEELAGIDSGKFNEVCRDVESVVSEGHKVLMFSSFVKHLDLYRSEFSGMGIRFAYLTGSLSQRERIEAIKVFQKEQDCPVFLISLKAGGVGLNLTAADYVFMLDPWWNPAAEIQALNRAHRIGQKKNVFVYRFISSSTIEEKIQRLQVRKMALAESMVGSNNPLRGLSEAEILELFS
jgi:SNF2 family DNA or RNA helicase